jgi:hypothetical protein
MLTREKGRLQSALNFSVRKSRKEKLQPLKKLYSCPKRVREQLHEVLSQKAKSRRGQAAEGSAGSGDPALSPPPKVNSRGRKINLSKKFK